ncbi:MAG: inorganic diphosphatase [Chloroflexi bacterium]|nr:inorganic diphosphatase [Chloroflexota bacterium]
MRARRKAVPARVAEVFVEIPRGSRNKYEYDETRGVIRLDRVLYSSVHYPTDYGFVPATLAEDGDHLDALVVVEEPTFPGCLVKTRVIGALRMIDERGEDNKILGVPVGDRRFDDILDIDDLPHHWLREIENFFGTYKTLEGVETRVMGWDNVDTAWDIIEKCRERAKVSGHVSSQTKGATLDQAHHNAKRPGHPGGDLGEEQEHRGAI